MPVSIRDEEPCPRCGDASETWLFHKREGSNTKRCYTCDACGCEWTEID